MADQDLSSTPRKLETAIVVALWLVSSVLSVVLIPVTIDILTRIYIAFWADYSGSVEQYWSGVAIRQFAVIPLAMVAIVVIIGGAEYYLRNFGRRKSWMALTRTLAVELGILLMAWIL
ncbi:MAG: hypothetical protein ACP5HS_11715 [Anaerolineae bacterium]